MKDTFHVADFGLPEVRLPRVYHDCIKGSVFRSSGQPPDPAGLCDGGDWIQSVQIRIDGKTTGRVYIAVEPIERGEWYSLELEWPEFFDMMQAAVSAHPKARHHKLDRI